THRYLDDARSAGLNADAYRVTIVAGDNAGAEARVERSVLIINATPTLADLLLTPAIREGGTARLTGTILDAGTRDTHV
ncbi:hypothetical protein, partial [Roseixanthobacter liquoris]|uniref:hypothetical protein n=1 Tax=Roseixanthobacter liquoris TaxID=3119921 RepID=UPI00372CA46B